LASPERQCVRHSLTYALLLAPIRSPKWSVKTRACQFEPAIKAEISAKSNGTGEKSHQTVWRFGNIWFLQAVSFIRLVDCARRAATGMCCARASGSAAQSYVRLPPHNGQ
jgi:hypothetical protein